MNNRDWAERVSMSLWGENLDDPRDKEIAKELTDIFAEHEAAVREENQQEIDDLKHDIGRHLRIISEMESRDSEAPSSGLPLCPGP